jgi:hypothetical protein
MAEQRGFRKDWLIGILGVVLLAIGLGYATLGMLSRAKPAATVIELTQVPCQFLESENGVDRGFQSHSAADCDAVNARTGTQRVTESKPLVLAPGTYVFRVSNKNVPYELGFWLRGDGLLNRAKLPSVSGGGLVQGGTQDYEITLKPGEYVYSCPLNPTPDYKLVVKG